MPKVKRRATMTKGWGKSRPKFRGKPTVFHEKSSRSDKKDSLGAQTPGALVGSDSGIDPAAHRQVFAPLRNAFTRRA